MPRFKIRDFGTSLLFDGVDDTVVIPHNANQLLTGGFTLSTWIRPRTLGESSLGNVIDKSTGLNGANGYVFQLTGTAQMRLRVGSVSVNSATNSVVLNQWQHVLVTVAADATVTHYINGAVSGTPSATSALSAITTTASLTIGNRSGATDRTFDGNIDEPRIWNRVLTVQEISDLCFNGTYSTTGLIGEYLFNEGSGTVATDTSASANNGTITGATYSADVPMKARLLQRNANAAILANGADGAAGNILSVPFSATLNPTAAVTLEIWFRPTALKAGILFDNSTVGTTNSYFLSMGADGSMNWFSTIGGLSKTIVGTAKKAKFFEWNCVSATYNGSAVLIFLNGSQLAETLAASGALGTNSGPLRIGAYFSGGISATFLGNLSQPRVYAAGCTLAEHQDRYFRGITSAALQAALVLDLDTQLGAGSTVTDLSGLGNHATMGASASWTSDSPFKARKASVNANMVKNGDFEYAPPFTAVTTGGNGWVIGTTAISTTNDLFGWYKINGAGTFAASFDSVTKYAGSYSMKLESTDATGRGRVLTAPFESTTTAVLVAQYGIPVQPSTDYGLSAFIKTAGANASSVRISAIYYTADGTQSGSANSAFQSSTQDFTQVSLRFTTASTTRFLVIKCDDNVATAAAHQTWFDNVTLTPVYPEGRVPANGNLVKNFDFEVAPTFVAAGTTKNRWIDGTAAGSSTNATYKWAINNTNTIGTNFAANFDTSEFHSGTASMKLSTTGTGTTLVVSNAIIISLAGVQTCIPAVPNVSYTYSYWMKTNYVSGDSSDGAYMAFRTRNAAGSTITTTEGTQIKTTTDWTQYTGTFTTGASTVWIEVFPIIQGDTGAGTLIMDAWFDDIYLAPTTNPGRIAIT